MIMLLSTTLRLSLQEFQNRQKDYKMKTLSAILSSALFIAVALLQTGVEAKQATKKEKSPAKAASKLAHPKKQCCSDPIYACASISGFVNITSPFLVINFDVNDVVPKGIVHPVTGDDSRFEIKTNGLYQIQWDVTLTELSSPSTAALWLRNSIDDTIYPSSFQIISLLTGSTSFAGQTLLRLQYGDMLQLEVANSGATAAVSLATLVITRIQDR